MSRYLPPSPWMLQSKIVANLTWKDVIGEWIDNAFDAKATMVTIEFTKDMLRVHDDGVGCADPGAMIQLGSHRPHSSTEIGQYGMGGKDAALWAGGSLDSTVEIITVHAGVRRMLKLHWQQYGDSGWECDDPHERPAEPFETGTSITIWSKKRRTPPHGEKWKELVRELGYIFSAGIAEGRQIKLKRPGASDWDIAPAWKMPPFDGEVIDRKIEVNGRHVRIKCGVVAEGQANPHGGFTYWRRWRVIEKASGNGCGRYSTSHVCGVVRLDHNWPLSTHKNAISRGGEELYDAVEEVCRPILERADKVGMTLDSEQFRAGVDAQLNAILNHSLAAKAKRARRKEGPQGIAHSSPGTGSPHAKAKREQAGSRFVPRKGGRYRIDYASLGSGDVGQIRPPSSVVLNVDNPAVAQARNDKNVMATVILAICLLGAEQCYAPQGQPDFLQGLERGFSTEVFAKNVGLLLSGLTIDGNRVLHIVA